MPELPEVETIVRRLARELPDRRIARAEILRDNVVRGSVRRFVRSIEGAAIETVSRRGKFIVVRLADGRVWLTHLRMSGKYLVAPPEKRTRGPGRPGRAARSVAEHSLPAYTRAVFHLDGGPTTVDEDHATGARLLYIDPRTLGEMEIVSATEWERRDAALGLEPLGPAFTAGVLRARLAGSRRSVKELLLDQTKVAGLGNIYAAEALWRARMSPRRRGRSVGAERAARLHRAIVGVLEEAIGMSGTSLGATYLDWVDGDGDPGAFYDSLSVYDREGEPCCRCGTPIRRIVQRQRSTYFCPTCQR